MYCEDVNIDESNSSKRFAPNVESMQSIVRNFPLKCSRNRGNTDEVKNYLGLFGNSSKVCVTQRALRQKGREQLMRETNDKKSAI